MPIRTMFFQQFDKRVEPSVDEVFAQSNGHFGGHPVKLYVIGTSHHITVGGEYTERLACDTEVPELLAVQVHSFQQDTTIGTFVTRIWQEVYSEKIFRALELSHLQEAWNLVHCFYDNSAFTGIRLTNFEVETIHTYPEYRSLVFSKTRLVDHH